MKPGGAFPASVNMPARAGRTSRAPTWTWRPATFAASSCARDPDCFCGWTRSGSWSHGEESPNIQATPQEIRPDGSQFVRCHLKDGPRSL